MNEKFDLSKLISLEKAFWTLFSEQHASFPGFEAYLTQIGEPLLNVILCTPEINTSHFRTHILDAATLFLKYQLPWTLWCTKESGIDDTLLEEYNFSLFQEVPALYFDLNKNQVKDPISVLKLKNVIIKEALTEADLSDWFEPIIEGYKIANNNTDFLQLTAKKPMGPDQPFRHFIAYSNDNPIASITLFLHDEYCMIQNIATKNDFIKRGLASAMVLHALQQAQENTCQIVVLDSSQEEVNLYKKLGFQELLTHQVYQQNLL